MQSLRSMRQKVAVLVHGAALRQCVGPHQADRLLQSCSAVDDDEARRRQTTRNQVIEQTAPGSLGLAADVATACRTFWPSRRTPNSTSNEIDVALPSELHPHHRAIQDQPDNILGSQRTMAPRLSIRLHLPPGPTDDILADRTLEQRSQRSPDPTRVGTGQVGACDVRRSRMTAPTVPVPAGLQRSPCAETIQHR